MNRERETEKERHPYLRDWQRRERRKHGRVQRTGALTAGLPVTCSAAHDRRGLLGLLR